MREVLKTAPKANPATLQRLSRPKHAVVRHPGDSCMYAGWKSLQLSKQRAAREQQKRDEARYEAARQEALQGWLRAREQVSEREFASASSKGRPVVACARWLALLALHHDLRHSFTHCFCCESPIGGVA